MIIRMYEREFTLISQHHHAAILEKIVSEIKTEYFPNDRLKSSVLYAIKMHDCGWIKFDKEPMWNGEQNAPFSFIDFPVPIKTVIYKHGIDEVEKHDAYATLLCSKHYSNFLIKDTSMEARQFLAEEEARQVVILNKIDVDDEIINFHFELLKFADSYSLFLCLNEPGSSKEKIHPFFRNGISLPKPFEKTTR